MGQLEGGLDAYKFLTMGEGECADRQGRRMARYTGDVEDESECEYVCRGDPQCAGFAYSFPLCSIYGTVRNKAPADRPWSFQAGTDPPAIIIEKALMTAQGQRKSICRKKGMTGDTIIDPSDIKVTVQDFFGEMRMAIFFVALLLCFFAVPIIKFTVKIICCRRDDLEIRAMELAETSDAKLGEVAQDPNAMFDENAALEYDFQEGDEGYDGQDALRDGAEGEVPPPLEGMDLNPEPPPSTPPNPPGAIEAQES